MQLPVRNLAGEVVDKIEVDGSVFEVPLNRAVVHQAMVRQLANARLGTADTKTRAEVAGSTRKLYRQKHTGRARKGSAKSPLLKGGGVTFGPHQRSYRQRMPKKMRRLALRCLLSAKASSGEILVVDKLKLEQPKTAEMAKVLSALGVKSSALVVTHKPEASIVRSAQNLQGVRTLPADLLNVKDLLTYDYMVIGVDGLRAVENALTVKSGERVG
ncbi:MAG: 50S ribosomal protein L4 [Dehalococcoidia bacterium]|nr:50S ribosomal protein L4 [Dehalococcoidia bacterium]